VRLQGGEPAFVAADAVLDADPADHALAVVCAPNNPTGTDYERAELEGFAARCRGRHAPARRRGVPRVHRSPLARGEEGVVVARSLTKLFGLPGIRAGFAVATGKFGAALERARRPWNVSVPALATGAHCMRQGDL